MSENDGRILDYDPILGITEKYYEQDGKWIIARDQEVEPILETNLRMRNKTDERARFKSDSMNHVAFIPAVVLEDLRKKGILDDQKALRKWLNDRDNMPFRTNTRKV